MKKHQLLISNIIGIFFCFYLIHALYFCIITYIFKIKISIMIIFLTTSLLYDVLLYFGLIKLLHKFVFEKSGKMLRKLNLANIISLFRLTSLPAIFILLLNITSYHILPFFLPYVILVFITDFIDGLIARLLNEVTLIGKYIDSSSDYLILISVSIIFFFYNLIPVWFFILIIVRLSVYMSGMILISFLEKRLLYDVSFLGKLSIFLAMFLYTYELVSLLDISILNMLKPFTEVLIGLVILVSLVEKVISLFLLIRKLKKGKQDRPATSVNYKL